MPCSSIIRIRSRMRCKRFFKNQLNQPAKTSLPAALFLLREGDGGKSALLSICCQNVVKTPNECKNEPSRAISRCEKSPISRASWVVRVETTDSAVNDHVPWLKP